LGERSWQKVCSSQRDYSLSFKLAVVEQVEKGEMSYKQAMVSKAARRPGMATHGRQDWSQGAAAPLAWSKPMNPDQAHPLTPEQRIKELERQLELANQKHSSSRP